MTQAWKRFLLIHVPLAAVLLGLICETIALPLSHLPLRRNRIDELALAVLSDPGSPRIVLLGDSIIRNATLRFAAGSGDNVLNLTTQQYVGLPSDLFLLQRYLEMHRAPEHVVVAAAPDDYHVMPDPRTTHYYMWNTFARPDERAFLKAYMPSIDARQGWPAATDLQQRILEPLITLLKRGPALIAAPPSPADPNAFVEPAADNQASTQTQEERVTSHDLSLAPLYRASIAGLCRLSVRYGFMLDVVWAPMPPRVVAGWRASGRLAALDKQLQDVFAAGCNAGPIHDMNDVRSYTNFDSAAFHLCGLGWEQRAASDLSQYMQGLSGQQHTSMLERPR